jgi:hypothetical protein
MKTKRNQNPSGGRSKEYSMGTTKPYRTHSRATSLTPYDTLAPLRICPNMWTSEFRNHGEFVDFRPWGCEWALSADAHWLCWPQPRDSSELYKPPPAAAAPFHPSSPFLPSAARIETTRVRRARAFARLTPGRLRLVELSPRSIFVCSHVWSRCAVARDATSCSPRFLFWIFRARLRAGGARSACRWCCWVFSLGFGPRDLRSGAREASGSARFGWHYHAWTEDRVWTS